MVTRKDSGESTISIKLLNLQDRVLSEGGEAGYITCMTQDTIPAATLIMPIYLPNGGKSRRNLMEKRTHQEFFLSTHVVLTFSRSFIVLCNVSF